MAYRFDSGSARNRASSVDSENTNFASALRVDAAGPASWDTGQHFETISHTTSPTAWNADIASTFAGHTLSPFDHALQTDHAAAAHTAGHAPVSNVDSSMLAQLDALLPSAPDGFVMRCMCPACTKAAITQLSGDHDAQAPHHAPTGGHGTFALDDIPDDNSSTVSLNAQEGQSITSTIQDQTDQDWFRVNLSDTNSYKFTLTPTDTSGTGPDLIITMYDEDGNQIGDAQDGHSFGVGEELTFTPSADGTYFVSVSSYASLPNAEYTIFGRIDDTPDPNAGTPLDAIDWGGTANRVDTDGVESANGDDVIHVYFAQTGEIYESALAGYTIAQDWTDYEKAAAYNAFEQYDHIINTDYVEVSSAEDADFVLISHAFEPNILGVMAPPNEPHEGQAEFNNQGVGWTESGLAQGGFGFITLIHELGHGHGLAHPHDTGGGSTIMNGVVEETGGVLDYTTGDYGLNTGIYTTMSYNDGWDKDGPNGAAPTNDYGYQGTLMAFDVAVLQQKYGANMDYKTGNDVYSLPEVNEAGTFYSCIWDAGGNDTISGKGALDAIINLNAATLQYEVGGGGWVSWADGIFGGYTIAHNVVIENAVGGHGTDTITGNDADNHLKGGGGADTIGGGVGADTIQGGRGTDQLTGGAGNDVFVFREGGTGGGHRADTIADLSDTDVVDLSGMDADTGTGGDQGFVLVSHFHGVAGEMTVKYLAGPDATRISMDTDGDGHTDLVIVATGNHATYDNFVL